jgi:hypothetical protein
MVNADIIRHVMADMDIKKRFLKLPDKNPPRRKPSVMNESSHSDYMKNYMQDYRKEEGKDYQKVPPSVKKYRAEQRKRLKEKFCLKK